MADGKTSSQDEPPEVELGNVQNVRLLHARDFVEPQLGYNDVTLHDVVLHAPPRRTTLWTCLKQGCARWRESPLLFWGGLCGLVTLVLVIVLMVQQSRASPTPLAKSCVGPGAFVGDTTAPEGSIRSSSFEARFDYRGRPRLVNVQQGVVAADHSRCSDIGLKALQDGGNAVDAAVATALCEGVMNPMASGLGGGHFMLIRLPNGTAEVIDAREVAPAAANETMYKDAPERSVSGGLSVAVPLELRGLALAHARHGRLPWARLVEPSINAAERGFPAHPYLVAALQGQARNITDFVTNHPLFRDTFLILDSKGWRVPNVNETCCARPSLAKLLREVAASGPEVLYSGKFAEGLVAEVAAAGGVLTLSDLAAARPTVRMPLRASAMGVDLLTPPPPSSGAAVLSALMVLAGYDLPLSGAESLGVHRMVESLKHAFALRLSLGDPGPPWGPPPQPKAAATNSSNSSSTSDVPEWVAAARAQAPQPVGAGAGKTAEGFADVVAVLKDMLSEAYAETLRSAINDSGVLDSTAYGGHWGLTVAGGPPPDDHGTSHISVVDESRMAVSMTTTINSGFGAKLLSKSTGIVLNNQMDDFSTPGRSNLYGLPPGKPNYIRPGKRPLSSMAPIIVEQGGQLRAVIGASGGPRIISAVLQTLVRVLAYGEDLFSSVANPRLHHQLIPDSLFAENWATGGGSSFVYNEKTLQGLQRRGHNIKSTDWGAVSQAITVSLDDGGLTGVSDPRKDGAPAGY